MTCRGCLEGIAGSHWLLPEEAEEKSCVFVLFKLSNVCIDMYVSGTLRHIQHLQFHLAGNLSCVCGIRVTLLGDGPINKARSNERKPGGTESNLIRQGICSRCE